MRGRQTYHENWWPWYGVASDGHRALYGTAAPPPRRSLCSVNTLSCLARTRLPPHSAHSARTLCATPRLALTHCVHRTAPLRTRAYRACAYAHKPRALHCSRAYVRLRRLLPLRHIWRYALRSRAHIGTARATRICLPRCCAHKAYRFCQHAALHRLTHAAFQHRRINK